MAVFSRLVISAVGALKQDNPQIRKWVEANGGTWSTSVKTGVTHLIASKAAWKKPDRAIKQAKEEGAYVVTYDWLEDSLMERRKLAEKQYTWEKVMEEKKQRKLIKKLGAAADSKLFREGCAKAEELTGSGTSTTLKMRKPRKLKGFFFGTSTPAVPEKPFVTASKDLQRRKAEREAAHAGDESGKEERAEDDPDDEEEGSSHGLPTPAASSSPAPQAPQAQLTPTPSGTTPLSHTPSVSQAKKSNIKDLYHYFRDQTGFEYNITLARSSPATNTFARYHLALLESHTKPHVYCSVAQYTPPRQPLVHGDIEPEPATPSSHHTPLEMRRALQAFLRYDEPAQSPSSSPKPQPDAQHLTSLVTKPSPDPYKPYKALLTPLSSPFDPAFRSFRHAFRDITLLAWEERFDANKTLQTARAKDLQIEPYLYKRPKLGMPMGLLPQVASEVLGVEDGYERGRFGLPGICEGLVAGGVIGSRVERERMEELRWEEERVERERGESKEKSGGQRRVRYDKPLFNTGGGIMGGRWQRERKGWEDD